MRIILIIILLAGIGYFGWHAIQTEAPDSIPSAIVSDAVDTGETNNVITTTEDVVVDEDSTIIDNEKITVNFIGYGPGKQHYGTIVVQSADLMKDAVVGIKGSVVVDMKTISAEVPAVSTHLKSKDFFEVEKYPTAKIVVEKFDGTNLVGNLTIRNITKSITIPVTSSDTQYVSEFKINMKEFGIDQKFANEEVSIKVTVPLK